MTGLWESTLLLYPSIDMKAELISVNTVTLTLDNWGKKELSTEVWLSTWKRLV